MSATIRPGQVLVAAIAFAMLSTGPASAVPKPPVKIEIRAISYSAPQVTVKVGDTVEWINQDIVDHTVTEKAAKIWNASIAPAKSAKVVMKKAGTFSYYCRYHPNMVGRVVVSTR
jgi:plastocyanin